MLDCGAVDAVACLARPVLRIAPASAYSARAANRAQRQQLAGSVPSVAGWDLDFDIALDDEQLARDCFRILRGSRHRTGQGGTAGARR